MGEMPTQAPEKQQPAQKAAKTTKDKTNKYKTRTAMAQGIKKNKATTFPVTKSTTKTPSGQPSQSQRKRRIANPHVLALNISSCTINRISIFVSRIPPSSL